MPKANVWLQFQYCTCVCWCIIYVCSPNVVALVLGFFDATSIHNVPKYYCGYIYIYVCIHLVWGYNLVWGYCIANQNQCMTTKPCFGLLFKTHLDMVGVTCQNNLHKKQPLVVFFNDKKHLQRIVIHIWGYFF